VERTGRKTGTRERRRARLGESGARTREGRRERAGRGRWRNGDDPIVRVRSRSPARTREGRRERAGRGRWRNGDDPIVRVRSRSPYYDVTNFLCFVFH
jgi:hypothetical protein